MGIEYTIHTSLVSKDVLSFVFESIRDSFPLVQCVTDDDSLWIRSMDSKYVDLKWIAFSIEKSNDGLFVLNNLNGADTSKMFSCIESALMKNGIVYSIEEI